MSRPAYSTSVLVETASNETTTNTIFGTQTITTTASEIKVGATRLSGRNSVLVQASNINTGTIYLGINSNPTTTNCMYELVAGAGLIITLDKYSSIQINAIASVSNQKINVTEIK